MNVTTDDIIPYAGRKDQPKRFKLLSIMRIGKRYRPYQFKNNKISPQRIAVHLNRLHDEGYIDRILENGLIWWERKK